MFDRSFYFLRHGQTDWNVAGRLQGHTDIPLNETGMQQARAVASAMASLPIETCVASDLSRAVTTAKNAMKYCQTPFYINPNLRERSFGVWEGQLSQEAKRKAGLDPYARLIDHTPPKAESWETFTNRVIQGVNETLEQHKGDVLLVAHGYVFVALTKLLIDADVMSGNCVPYRFEKAGKRWEITPV